MTCLIPRKCGNRSLVSRTSGRSRGPAGMCIKAMTFADNDGPMLSTKLKYGSLAISPAATLTSALVLAGRGAQDELEAEDGVGHP